MAIFTVHADKHWSNSLDILIIRLNILLCWWGKFLKLD